MAVAKLGTDTTTTFESTSVYSFDFSHTLVAAPTGAGDRVIVVAVGGETSDSNLYPAWSVSAISYGGNAMSQMVTAVTTENTAGLNNNRSSLWIIRESMLPANGLRTVAVTGTTIAGASVYLFGSAAEYCCVDQTILANTSSAFVNSPSPSPTIGNNVDPNNADLVMSSYICGNAGSFTVGQGQVEIFDATNPTAPTTTFGFCELTFATPGPYSLTSTYSATANRLTRVAASLVAKRTMNSTTAISRINGVTRHNMGSLNTII